MVSHIGRRELLVALGGVAARGARATARPDAAYRRAHELGRGRSGSVGPRHRARAGAAAIGLDCQSQRAGGLSLGRGRCRSPSQMLHLF